MGTHRLGRVAVFGGVVLALFLLCVSAASAGVHQRVLEAMDQTRFLPRVLFPSQAYCTESAMLPPGAVVLARQNPAPSSRRGLAAGDRPGADDLDDYESGTIAIADPFERWNRFWFSFNDFFYLSVADPIYRGWQYITPPQTRWALKNFLHNALFPIRFVNAVLQGKLKVAGVEFSRFMMDTMCSAGFSNPSQRKKTIVPVDPAGEDFGQTLGVWGIGTGPYIVWPFLGPSSLRDSIGRVGDWFLGPFFYVQPWWASYASAGVLRFNDLDSVLPLYKDLSSVALDPYISMRDAYATYRFQHVQQ